MVIKSFDVKLRSVGYRTYIPCRDMIPGTLTEETLRGVKWCTHYIVIISYMFVNVQKRNIKWRYIWTEFKSSESKEVIIINFDHLDSVDCQDAPLKAFLRL